jgi:hypothetical protein
MTWVHWVVCDIPPSASGLAEAVKPGALPPGTRGGDADGHLPEAALKHGGCVAAEPKSAAEVRRRT